MRPLSAAELLTAWEQGSVGPPFSRTFPLLAIACPDLSFDTIETLSVGQRDARLLKLREWTFGSKLPSVAICPRCGERVEWIVDSNELQFEYEAHVSDQMAFDIDNCSLNFRLPNSRDLAAVAASESPGKAKVELFKRCVLDARIGERQVSPEELSDEVSTALAHRMAELDPFADVQMDLTCPSCGRGWQVLLDVESFFWSELNAWAKQILSEVHVLASAYGWRESDILNLSPLRREYYLELVNG